MSIVNHMVYNPLTTGGTTVMACDDQLSRSNVYTNGESKLHRNHGGPISGLWQIMFTQMIHFLKVPGSRYISSYSSLVRHSKATLVPLTKQLSASGIEIELDIVGLILQC